MKNQLSLCFACCLTLLNFTVYAQAPDKIFSVDIAQDSTGQVWSSILTSWFGAKVGVGSICRWVEPGKWENTPTPPTVEGAPGAMARLPSGAVVCLWSKGNAEYWLTVHRGSFSRLAGHWTGFLQSPHLFGDGAGNVWVTGLGGDIYRVPVRLGDKSAVEFVETIPDTDYYPGYQKSNDGPDQGRWAGLTYHDPLFAAPDSKGRMWIWTDSLAGADNYAALHGILRFENGKMVHYTSLAGVPDKPLTWIAPHGKRLWVAVKNTGLYDVDADTLSGMPVPEPELHAFQYIQTIFASGTDWYVVAGYPSNLHSGAPISTLWRLRGGAWRKMLSGLDTQALSQDFARRPHLATPEGLWLGSYGCGAWLLPAGGGAPVRLDWHYGNALSNSDHLFAVKPALGGVLAFRSNNANGATVNSMQAHLETQVLHPQAARMRTLATTYSLVQDGSGHLWNLITPQFGARGADRKNASLDEWNGSVWISHSFPPEADPTSFSSFFADSKNRLWLRPWSDDRPVFVYDPSAGSWLSYPDYKKALLGQLDLPGFAIVGVKYTAPVFGPDRRVACRNDNWQLNLFDGHIWHQWKRADIIPNDTQFAFEPPFFSKAGLLSVNIDHDQNKPDAAQKSWVWTEAAGWHQVPYEEGPNDWIVGIRHSQIEPPAGCPKPDFLSLVKDNKGTLWLTSNHILYTVKDGKCKPAQEADLPTPFLDGRRVSGAMTDPLGNTFLMTESGNSSEYVVVPHPQ